MFASADSNRFPEAPGNVLRLCGAEGSPYSQKMLAVLRYRRLPHRWLVAGGPESRNSAEPPGPPLLPKLLFPDGSVKNDSTLLILDLEVRFQSRACIPPVPSLAFLVALMEDYCDEWLTKAMFHYRWTYDIDTAAFGIGTGMGFSGGPSQIHKVASFIGERQVARLRDVVGSNEITGPVIEASFKQFLSLLEAHFHSGHDFLFGSRPSAADFALYGQLHPMISMDPNTSQKVFAASKTVWFWYHSMKDLSGLSLKSESDGWFNSQALPSTLVDLFVEVGRLYAPFMLANAEAVQERQDIVECKLDAGRVPWKQASFKYQAKCLKWLRSQYQALSVGESEIVRNVLFKSDCSGMFVTSLSSL